MARQAADRRRVAALRRSRRAPRIFLLGLILFAVHARRLDPVLRPADLARRRLVAVDPGAAVREDRAVQGARPLVRADPAPLVGDARARCSSATCWCRSSAGSCSSPLLLIAELVARRERARQRARAGRRPHDRLRDHVSVPHRGPDDPVLRPARAQGGLRPPADGARASASSPTRARPWRRRTSLRRPSTRPSRGPPRRTGRRRPAGSRLRRAGSRAAAQQWSSPTGWTGPQAPPRDDRPAGESPWMTPSPGGVPPGRWAPPTGPPSGDAPPPRDPRGAAADRAASARRGAAADGATAARRRGAAADEAPPPAPTTTSATRRPSGRRATSRAGREGCEARPRRGRRARPRGRGGLSGIAQATEVTADEFRTLAGEAVDDRAALAELRRVDVVDGQPVDVRGALRGARGDDLEVRLRHARGLGPGRGSEPLPRRPARGGPRGARRGALPADSPRPFKGFFEWLAELLPAFDWLDDLVPGPPGVAWLVLARALRRARGGGRPARPDAPRRHVRGRAGRGRGAR